MVPRKALFSLQAENRALKCGVSEDDKPRDELRVLEGEEEEEEELDVTIEEEEEDNSERWDGWDSEQSEGGAPRPESRPRGSSQVQTRRNVMCCF